MKFKVINEYKHFYLCKSPKGYCETFNKFEFKPDEDGYIYKNENDDQMQNKMSRPAHDPFWNTNFLEKRRKEYER